MVRQIPPLPTVVGWLYVLPSSNILPRTRLAHSLHASCSSRFLPDIDNSFLPLHFVVERMDRSVVFGCRPSLNMLRSLLMYILLHCRCVGTESFDQVHLLLWSETL
eukprot:TRINITY_DN38916_c0_g1_i3.p2 TRINITY_DN38916_c0_g1~~TRINITY_DN38916_c0_g1_i3.p2  ORF type:complete len:106 (+),score=4.07 TRINITY_DN38916_c0_g1_i3:192-509(+)